MEKEKRLIVGLTGKLGSGKGTIAEYLAGKGFWVTSLSDRIREEIKSRGEEVTREKLLQVADELRQYFGPEVLAKRTWEKLVAAGVSKAVIDSIRGEAEVDFLKGKEGFVLLGVVADPKVRFERVKARQRESDPQTLEEFLAVEEKDIKSGQGKVGRDIEKCLEKADFIIENNGTIEQLQKKIEEILLKEFYV